MVAALTLQPALSSAELLLFLPAESGRNRSQEETIRHYHGRDYEAQWLAGHSGQTWTFLAQRRIPTLMS